MKAHMLRDTVLVRKVYRAAWVGPKEHPILLPISTQALSRLGRVVAVGPDAATVTVGDLVLLSLHSGREIELDGETFLIMGEDEILATITGGLTVAADTTIGLDDPRWAPHPDDRA